MKLPSDPLDSRAKFSFAPRNRDVQHLCKNTANASHDPSYALGKKEEEVIYVDESSVRPPQQEVDAPQNEAAHTSPVICAECGPERGYFIKIYVIVQSESQESAIGLFDDHQLVSRFNVEGKSHQGVRGVP